MAATTRPPDRTTRPGAVLLRFDRVERAVHWVNAVLFLILVVTGGALYLEPVGALIGRRGLVQNVHLYAGLALPVPLIAALCGSWGRGLRSDVRRFNRWTKDDREWLRVLLQSRTERHRRRKVIRVGKFNAGQKLNASFIAGAGLVLLGTGVIMRWYHPWPLGWRTGATFVHDWLALGAGLVILGHIWMAFRDWDAMRAMLVGTVSRSWARRHAPAWEAGEDGPTTTPAVTAGSAAPRGPLDPGPDGPARPTGRRRPAPR